MNARGSEIDCMRREKSMGIWKGGARGAVVNFLWWERPQSWPGWWVGGVRLLLVISFFLTFCWVCSVHEGAWEKGGKREEEVGAGGGDGDRRLSVLSGFAWEIYSSTTPLPGAILTSAPHSNHYSVCITTSVSTHGLPIAYLSGFTAVCFLGIFVRS
jgi:hypothetical protein